MEGVYELLSQGFAVGERKNKEINQTFLVNIKFSKKKKRPCFTKTCFESFRPFRELNRALKHISREQK